jgi:hypothetical protein
MVEAKRPHPRNKINWISTNIFPKMTTTEGFKEVKMKMHQLFESGMVTIL